MRPTWVARKGSGTVADVLKKSSLIIPVEPFQVHAEHSCRLDQRQSLGEPPAGQRAVAARPQPLSGDLNRDTLVHRKIRFIAIKEGIEFDGKQDLRTKVMIALFGLFAALLHDSIPARVGLLSQPPRSRHHSVGFWPTQLGHPVEDVTPDRGLPTLRLAVPCLQVAAEHGLVSEESVLNARLLATA